MKIKLLSFFVISLVFSCTSNSRKMDSSSMEPTILKGEEILIANPEVLKRQDIIVFNYHHPSLGKKEWVFRIVGIPGDTIQISKGLLYVNGRFSDEPYAKFSDEITDSEVFQPEILGSIKENSWNVDNIGPIIIPVKGEIIRGDSDVNGKLYKDFLDDNGRIAHDLYFLLGDSRHDAYDSRFIGLIPKSEIAGIVKGK